MVDAILDLEQFDDTIGIVTDEFTNGMLTVAFAKGIRRIDLLIAPEITRHLALVAFFFPRIKTFGANAFAVTGACLVLAAEMVDEHLARSANETVVLVRPKFGFACAGWREVICGKVKK